MEELKQILKNQIIIMEYLKGVCLYGNLKVHGYVQKLIININVTKEILVKL